MNLGTVILLLGVVLLIWIVVKARRQVKEMGIENKK